MTEALEPSRSHPGTAWRFPAFARTTPAPGITLITCPLAGRGLVGIRVVLECGPTTEPAEQRGVAALAARALLEGTVRRTAAEVGLAVDDVGASLDVGVDWDVMRLSGAVTARHWEALLEVLAEVVAEPSFPDEGVTRLRDERLAQLSLERSDPVARADEALLGSIYEPAARYAHPLDGERETVAGLDGAAVRQFWERASTGEMTVVVAGDVDGHEVERALRRAVRPPLRRDGARPTSADDAQGEARVLVIDRPGSAQSAIAVGHVGLPRSRADLGPLMLVQQTLGGGGMLTTRLNRKLREEKGYTYGAYAGFDLRRGAGPFAVRTTVEGSATVEAVEDIHGQIGELREHGVGTDELEVMRNFLHGSWPLRMQTVDVIASAIADLAVHGLPDDEYDRYLASLRAATREQVDEQARMLIDPERLVTVVVGDANRHASALESGGFGPLTVVGID